MTQAACVVTHLVAEERQFPLIVGVFLGKPDLVLSRWPKEADLTWCPLHVEPFLPLRWWPREAAWVRCLLQEASLCRDGAGGRSGRFRSSCGPYQWPRVLRWTAISAKSAWAAVY